MAADFDSTRARSGSSPTAATASSDDTSNTERCSRSAVARRSCQSRVTGARGRQLRRRQLAGLADELAPLLAQARNVERRRVHALGELAGAALETREQLVHRGERVVRCEQAFLLQALRDLGDELAAEAGDVGERREHPDRRRAKRDDAHELDAVARGPAQQKVLAELLFVRLRAWHTADVFDEELQRDVDEAAIETAAAKADRQRDGSDFAHGAGGERRRGTDYSLRQRRGVAHAAMLCRARAACL